LCLVAGGRAAADNEGARNAREVGRLTLGDAVDEILLLWIAADIGEGQDDNRKAGRLPILRHRHFRCARRDEGHGLRRLRSDERPILRRQRLLQPVEAVTLAWHGDDQSRTFRIRLDLSPQLADQHVDAAVERLKPPVGEGVQQSVATENSPWPSDEHLEHSELAARQRDCRARLVGQSAGFEI
jgi:hypothetical protein